MTPQEKYKTDKHYSMLVRTIVALLSEGAQLDEVEIVEALELARITIRLRKELDEAMGKRKRDIY
jgi:hypothetical protein